MDAERSDPSFVQILISYKEYSRLKQIEELFNQREKKLQRQLEILGKIANILIKSCRLLEQKFKVGAIRKTNKKIVTTNLHLLIHQQNLNRKVLENVNTKTKKENT
jgi:hypothetical protein